MKEEYPDQAAEAEQDYQDSLPQDGGSAFPGPVSIGPAGDVARSEGGMTLRDYFAAQALQGCLAYSHVNPSSGNYHENATADNVANAAYKYADAMIRARNA